MYDEERTFIHDLASPLGAAKGHAQLLLRIIKKRDNYSKNDLIESLEQVVMNLAKASDFLINRREVLKAKISAAAEEEEAEEGLSTNSTSTFAETTPATKEGAPQLLIIDDDDMICKLLHIYLDDTFVVHTECSSQKALKLIEKNSYSLILTDLHMPKLSGIGIIQKINELNHPAKIIIMSGYDRSHNEIKEALALGAVDLLTKPFEDENDIKTLLYSYIAQK